MSINPAAEMPSPALSPVLIASHPRSGTHLVIDTLRRQFASTRSWRWWGLPLDHLYLNVERLSSRRRQFSDPLARRIVTRPQRALMKTHFLADFSESWAGEESAQPPPQWMSFIQDARMIYVTRHPLDVLSSYLQFLSALDEEIHRMDLRSFLESPHWTQEVDRLGWWCRHVKEWLERPGILHLRYEDLVRNPSGTLDRLAAALREPCLQRSPLLPPKCTSVAQTRLDRVLKLSPSSTAIIADRDRFPQKPWQKTLSASDLAWVEGRCGELLPRLGYSLSR